MAYFLPLIRDPIRPANTNSKFTLKLQPEDCLMKSGFSRREMMKAVGASALLPASLNATQKQKSSWPPALGSNTPKLCLGVNPNLDEAGMRRVKQIGWRNTRTIRPRRSAEARSKSCLRWPAGKSW
jgi:hypothetical protein